MDGYDILTWLIAIGAILAVLGYLHRQSQGRGMPGPPGHPIIGHLLQLLRPDFHRVLSRWAEKYGGVYRISILGLQGVVVSDPEAIARVLGRDRGITEIPKHLASYSQLNLLWGDVHQHSIFTGPTSETWRLVRRAVSPCFSSANIRHTRTCAI
jgi:cytochrome P450